MRRIIEFLRDGCFHKWEVYEESLYEDEWIGVGSAAGQSEVKKGTKYTLRCSKCGNMRVFKT